MCKSRFVWGLVRFCELECDVLALLERATGGFLLGPPASLLFVWGWVCVCLGFVVLVWWLYVWGWWYIRFSVFGCF